MSEREIEWEVVAVDALAAIRDSAEKLVRKAADDFYADLLYSVQDYLCENATYNIRSRIEGAQRQAASDRKALYDDRRRSDALMAALKRQRAALDLIDPDRPLQYATTMDLMRKDADAVIAQLTKEQQ